MKNVRKLLLVTIMFISCLLTVMAQETESEPMPEFTGDNINQQNYAEGGAPMSSYLTTVDNGFMVLDNDPEKGIRALYYDRNYILQDVVEIPNELPYFGTFLATEDNYFIVTGTSNPEHSDEVECFRLTKYDKKWNRVGSAGLYGCDTSEAFYFGSCRMTYQKPYIIVNSCRVLYNGHQAKIGFTVNADEIIDNSPYRMKLVNYGWVSHSFNQFILVDDQDRMVTLDHGDTYDRGVILYRNSASVSNGGLLQEGAQLIWRRLLAFASNGGSTNASIGGFEESSTHYVAAGNSVEQSSIDNRTRNIWIATLPKDEDANDANVYWLTNMPEDGENHLTTPHLIDLNNDTFMAIWSDDGRGFTSYAKTPTLYYAILDHEGKQIGKTYTDKGILSDCKPIHVGNKLIWYIHEGKYVTFYEINLDTMKTTGYTAKTKDWVEVETIAIKPARPYVCLGYHNEFNVVFDPENSTDKRFTVESRNPDVLLTKNTPGEGEPVVVYGQSLGKSLFTVTSPKGISRTYEVPVLPIPTSFYQKTAIGKMKEGNTEKWDVVVEPEVLSDYIEYSSSDPKVITIDLDGNIKAHSPGVAHITACLNNVWKVEDDIQVLSSRDWVEVTSVSIEPKDFDTCLNDRATEIKVRIEPENATDKRYKISSGDSGIVECIGDEAHPRSIGETTLTVTTPNGKTDTANVHVLEALEDYKPDWIRYDVAIGQTVSAKIDCKPESLNKYIRYYSSDPSVASIDDTGMVTGLKEGTAIIYSRIGNNGPIQEIKVVFRDVDSIWFDKRYLDMAVEETMTLKVNYSPSTATNKTITWSSSDPKVATVDNNGKVTAVSEGTAIITATSYNGKTATCTLTVTKRIFATGISLNKTSRFFVEGGNETLIATVIPSDTTDKTVTWTSSDPKIATVKNGKVTAVKTGKTTITATTVNGLSATCSVTVVNEAIEPTGITLNKTELYVTYHDSVKLVALFLPENATETETDVTWESDNDAVATVDKGEVYGKECGKATITATTSNGLHAQCKVEVIGYVSSWGSSPLPSRMYVSEVNIHSIAVSPKECQKYVTYESSDPSVISVTNDGLLTALKVGKSTITIKCGSQELLSKTIEVYALDPESVSLNYNQLDLHVGTGNQLQAYILPDYANQTVTWQSSDQSVATVDNKGRVTGKSVGRATITATTSNGLTATCVVNVTENQPACTVFGFCTYNGKKYWYEDSKRQGVYGDPKNIKGLDPVLGMIERGREIYDPVSDGWYWLDAIYDGAAAFGKEVWMPYIYQDEDKWDDATIRKNANNADEGMKEYVYQCMKNKTGKWVRYDEKGKMLKGWVKIENRLAELYPEQKGNVYYYDHYTGLMAKGWITIDGTLYHFNEITGVRE